MKSTRGSFIEERLDQLTIEFEPLATVCKYVVPTGYPEKPVKNQEIDLNSVPGESARLRRYDAAVEKKGEGHGKHKKEHVGYKVQVAETAEEGELEKGEPTKNFITAIVTQPAIAATRPGMTRLSTILSIIRSRFNNLTI